MNPFAGRHWSELTGDEFKQRQQWMADEANRLIEARRQMKRPDSVVTVNAFPTPDAYDGDAAYKGQVSEAAQRIVASLNRRDR
jgi:hypothetical protein